ncbi:hypothetical protein NE236_20090 [Actinoallomurus purpureus]|uniref:hypothetical protein n=1 Tax=Actinoallomurus purpureus TaxID=478114 RepID=UPI002092B8A9|nr:hypothetical protein [Actinoallomurus purpureus]MCO6007286.1 hypothetical protein [Actinoallomurus purpureus]
MKLETLIQRSLQEWSAEARVPTGLADRALRRRTRRRIRSAALVAGAVAAVATTVVTVDLRTESASRPAAPLMPNDTSLHADPTHAPPRRLVAAGRVAISAYYIGQQSSAGGKAVRQNIWYLYDPASGGYRRTSWTYVDVAPGLGQAAVLEGPLPAARVGLLDMRTQKVTRWITLGRRAGGLAWSPDGRRLLVTTYDRTPDAPGGVGTSSRTGYYLVTAASGKAAFHALPADRNTIGARQDLGWSRNGRLLWAPTNTEPAKHFYDLNGRPQPAPPHEDETYVGDAGLSPSGRFLSRGNPHAVPGKTIADWRRHNLGLDPATAVQDVTTGKQVGVQPVEQLKAWADDRHLIAVACQTKACSGRGEFYNRYVLVSVDGKTITPLTGYQNSDAVGAWHPIFTPR